MEWKVIEPDIWKPEKEDDSITGVLLTKESRTGDLSAKYKVENKDGISLIWGSVILDDRLALVNIGDTVRVTYKGREKNKKGQDVKIFKVEVKAKTEEQKQAATEEVTKEEIIA